LRIIIIRLFNFSGQNGLGNFGLIHEGAKHIPFINMKGGVGKTTLVVNVGYTLAKVFDKRILIIDIDPQMNTTQHILSTNNAQLQDVLNNPAKTLFGILPHGRKIPSTTGIGEKKETDSNPLSK
jgi:chromosome partitioning protein